MISHVNHVQLCATIWTVAQQALCPWDYPSQNTGMCCRDFLQGIFLTQGWKLSLLNSCICRQIQQPIALFLPEEFHGQRSLVGYSPLGRKTVVHN